MTRFAPCFISAVHQRMQERRGRRVSLDKAARGVEKWLGSFSEEPFERLYAGCSSPWLVRVVWPGPEVGGIQPLSWFVSREAALAYVIGCVDRRRLYPTSLQVNGETLSLLKGDLKVIVAEPLAFVEVNPDVRAAALAALHCASGGAHMTVLETIARDLPNLSKLSTPYAKQRSYWKGDSDEIVLRLKDGSYLHEHGMITFEPEEAARRLRSMYAEQNIVVHDRDAQADLAYLLGFKSWEALRGRWDVLGAFAPFIVRDSRTRTHHVVRDLAAGFALLDHLCVGLRSGHTWRVRVGQHVDEVDVAVVVQHSNDNSRARADLTRFDVGHSQESDVVPFKGLSLLECASFIESELRVGCSVADKLEASQKRTKARTYEIGDVLVSCVRRRYRGDSDHYNIEVLNKEDGWRKLSREKALRQSAFPNDYPYSIGPMCLRLVRPAFGYLHSYGRTRMRYEFNEMLTLPGASREALMELCTFLNFEPLAADKDMYWGVPEEREMAGWMSMRDMERSFACVAEHYHRFIPFHARGLGQAAIDSAMKGGGHS